MANFIQLSDNCYLTANGKLISEVELPNKNYSVHVPPYLPIRHSSVITAMNLKQEDSKGYFSPTCAFSIGMCHLKFVDLYTLEISFVNFWDKSRHLLATKVYNISIDKDRNLVTSTFYNLDGKTAQVDMLYDASNITKIKDLGVVSIPYKSVRGKDRACELSYGLSRKKFDIYYQGKKLDYKSMVFFLGTYGILFNQKLQLTGVVNFSGYNNLYVDIKDVLYLAGADFYKAIMLSIQTLGK